MLGGWVDAYIIAYLRRACTGRNGYFRARYREQGAGSRETRGGETRRRGDAETADAETRGHLVSLTLGYLDALTPDT